MSKARKVAPGRIAYRVEGNFWVVYWALPYTMEGAVELGRIGMAFVQKSKYKRLFMTIMRDGLTEFFKAQGQDIDNISWKEEAAPEHERSGSA